VLDSSPFSTLERCCCGGLQLSITDKPAFLLHGVLVLTCRKALELISPDGEHASIYMQVQGNLGALLLSADRPVEALKELQEALQLGQHLHRKLQQQLQQKGHGQQQHAAVQQELDEVDKQLGGILFNQGKALTSVGR